MIVDILLSIILVIIIYTAVLFTLMWLKLKVYLVWNTRYEGAAYEEAITTPKVRKPSLPAKQVNVAGRAIKPVEDLVDLADLDFETGYKAVEALGDR